MQVGHFNWKRAPREWMVRLCSQPHLPGGRATLWLCGHYHASCAVHSRAGTEVVTTGAVGGVINWSQPPQVIPTSPVFNHSLTHSLTHSRPHCLRATHAMHQWLPFSLTGDRNAARLPVPAVRQLSARHVRCLPLRAASLPRAPKPDRPPLPRAQRGTAQHT